MNNCGQIHSCSSYGNSVTAATWLFLTLGILNHETSWVPMVRSTPTSYLFFVLLRNICHALTQLHVLMEVSRWKHWEPEWATTEAMRPAFTTDTAQVTWARQVAGPHAAQNKKTIYTTASQSVLWLYGYVSLRMPTVCSNSPNSSPELRLCIHSLEIIQ